MCSWLPNIRERLPWPSPWTKKTRHCERSEAVFLYAATSVICGFANLSGGLKGERRVFCGRNAEGVFDIFKAFFYVLPTAFPSSSAELKDQIGRASCRERV